MPWLRRLGPALGLFLLAPFVGEFLLGNLTVGELGLVLVLAPLYGFGALLVRELGRRSGGWPTMVLLAAAYALIEEGPVDQLLWNDSYAGHDDLHGDSYLPALGMSVELTQTILALHTVWSICVPIAIVETFVPERQTRPWLGRTGLTVTAVLYVLGAGWCSGATTPRAVPRLAGATGGDRRRHHRPGGDRVRLRSRHLPRVEGSAPSAWLVGGAVWLLVSALGVLLVSRWSRQHGWDQRHRFALAAGAALTYVWAAFPVRLEAGGSLTIDLVSNAVFGAVAIMIGLLAARVATRNLPAQDAGGQERGRGTVRA
jgi:hypothetical protein